MSQSIPPKREYRADIDGIRALAVLSVLIFHINPQLLPGGFLGVDIFFVISGYLITNIILQENHLGTFSFLHFYVRRIKRIFPALFVVLIVSSIVAALLLRPEMYVNFMKSARYASAQLSNFFFSQKIDYFSEGFSGQPLLHTWSLGVEEQFYLFWPLLIFLCFKLFRSATSQNSNNKQHLNRMIAAVLLLLSLVSFFICYLLADVNRNLAFYMFYSRAFEFCIGGFLSLHLVRAPKGKTANNFIGTLGFFLLCYSFLFIKEEFLGRSFLQFAVVIPCIGTAFIIYADKQKSMANRLLATRLPVSIGKISYSLYLYHWPVIIFWKLFNNTHTIGIKAVFIVISISFLLSILSYFLIEQPSRKANFPDKSVLISAIILIISFAVFYKIIQNCDEAPWRIKKYDQTSPIATNRYFPECKKTTEGHIEMYDCTDTPDKDVPVIALIGDSHAPHFLYSLTAWAKSNGYDVKFFSIAACPMLLGDIHIQNVLSPEYEAMCQDGLPILAEKIVGDSKVTIVLIAQRWDLFYNGIGFLNTSRHITFRDAKGTTVKDHISYYNEKLTFTVNSIKKEGKDVVILKQVPLFSGANTCNWEPRLKKMFAQDRVCSYDIGFIEQWQRPSISFIDDFVKTHQLEVFDPARFFKKPLINSTNMYLNIDHLNEDGLAYLTPYFMKEMDRILGRLKEKNKPR